MKWLVSIVMTVCVTIGSWLGLPCVTRMTNEEAKALAEDVMERATTVFVILESGLPIYEDGELSGRYEGPLEIPGHGGGWYRVGENPYGIYNNADFKAFAEATYTIKHVQKFNSIDAFLEHDGSFYFQHTPIGFYLLRVQTVRVTWQTKNTIRLKLECLNGEDSIVKVAWRLKWEGGAWKLDCHFDGIY